MKIVKRNEDCSVEKISNGFILSLEGHDKEGDWVSEKVFLLDLTAVEKLMSEYFLLEKR